MFATPEEPQFLTEQTGPVMPGAGAYGRTIHPGVSMSDTTTVATIRIVDLALRTIIGFRNWERVHRQDVVVNVSMRVDVGRAVRTDRVEDTVDYKLVKDRIATLVEESSFSLLERLAHAILESVMSHAGVLAATVRVDKPGALRYAKSVSVELSAEAPA
jgi:FolB domain-containing protein